MQLTSLTCASSEDIFSWIFNISNDNFPLKFPRNVPSDQSILHHTHPFWKADDFELDLGIVSAFSFDFDGEVEFSTDRNINLLW